MKEQVVPADLSKFEFETVCATPKCSNQAKWIGWVSHSAKECPNSSYACDDCKRTVSRWWSAVIRNTETHEIRCTGCKADIEGTISQHLRWLPL